MILGIDASNIRVGGGGITHLSQMLSKAEPAKYGIQSIVVWGGQATLKRLPQRHWLTLVYERDLDGPLPWRALWQQIELPVLIRQAGCDVLFAPGGVVPSRSRCPAVVMSQNLLPFHDEEILRYRREFARLRLIILRHMQAASFSRAGTVIFLTEYARSAILKQLRRPLRRSVVIPHGIDDRFRLRPRPQKDISEYSDDRPFRLLYVSTIRLHKHQWLVAQAVAKLRLAGVPIVVDFVGRADGPALRRLQRVMQTWDSAGVFLRYQGPVPFQELHRVYFEADGFIFASTCENLPLILLEAMAAGLPIACSGRGPMPEVLGDAGVYFDPEEVDCVVNALRELIENRTNRERMAEKAYKKAEQYSWSRCADETFQCIADTVKGYIEG